MTHYQRQRAKRASDRGKRMAKARWAKDRARRAALAAVAEDRPQIYAGDIARRVVVIDNERDVREMIVWRWDRPAEVRRKINKCLNS